jgi:hypothetical protein
MWRFNNQVHDPTIAYVFGVLFWCFNHLVTHSWQKTKNIERITKNKTALPNHFHFSLLRFSKSKTPAPSSFIDLRRMEVRRGVG